MQFRTEIEIEKSNFELNQKSNILTIGSCFADVIGKFLVENKLNCLSNPFGTVFNPISMINLLELALFNTKINENLFIQRDDLWFHFDFHSHFFAKTKADLKSILENKIVEVNTFLKQTDLIIITLGTAIVYELQSENLIVTNCHKIPAKNFKKRILNSDEIYLKISAFLNKLKSLYPQINIILSVSPVRHLKETLILNSVSKSTLRIVTHSLSSDYVEYFPAYEIMNDDLRDYRFYKDDMLHPTPFAEKYIIDKFQNSYFSNDLKKLILEWQKIEMSINHTVQNEGSLAHKKHLVIILNKLKEFSKKADVSKEIEKLETKIASF